MNRIKAIRGSRRLSQRALEELSGVPQATISRLERRPSLARARADVLDKIARALDVDFEELENGKAGH